MVYDDLEVVWSDGTSSLMAHAIEIMAQVHQLKRNALHARVNQSFMIAHSHYGGSIDLEAMSHGYAPGYVSIGWRRWKWWWLLVCRTLWDRIEGIVLPRRG